MKTGYPRFFVHKALRRFADDIVADHGRPGQQAMLFPIAQAARRCGNFIRSSAPDTDLHIIEFGLDPSRKKTLPASLVSFSPTIAAILFPREHFALAKQYWQHTGDGASSRRAEFCHELYSKNLLQTLPDGHATPEPSRTHPQLHPQSSMLKGPRRYHRPSSVQGPAPDPALASASPAPASCYPAVPAATQAAHGPALEDESCESWRFLEERFGRNLDLSLSERAKSAIRRRIAGAMAADADGTISEAQSIEFNSRGISNLTEGDVYLYPGGMNAIFHVHQALLSAIGQYKSINYGFPYVDTWKLLEKFGPGCVFYGHTSAAELDQLERRLLAGERFLALFCEFPGNPLLTCPDLSRIRRLADTYGFAVIIDETIGTFANVNVLQFADVVVSSLTKIFSGDCNVMGGSAILNPDRPHYRAIKAAMETSFQDTYWPEDAVFMERNSRDFESRIDRTNTNAEAICEVLMAHPRVKQIFYPKYNSSRPLYEACKRSRGGYGGLLSVVFHSRDDAVAFYDALNTAKGPSLGTNFTLTCPYMLLAFYQELDWASQFGADPSLIRVSVGVEDTDTICTIFKNALVAIER